MSRYMAKFNMMGVQQVYKEIPNGTQYMSPIAIVRAHNKLETELSALREEYDEYVNWVITAVGERRT